jgi:hypothetical protein
VASEDGEVDSEPSTSDASAEPASDSAASDDASLPDVDEPQGHPVKIYQVDEELDFLVLSVKGIDWVKQGSTMMLINQTDPVATVELTELDSAGFAVAQITHRMDPLAQFHKGDVLFARPLMKPAGE